ncbi:MAG: hypothetical protein V8Q75_03400 [Bacilli bacterium]
MKIEINNKQWLIVKINEKDNKIAVTKHNEYGDLKELRTINEIEFVDLYNILVYAQDHKIDIFRLWEVK